MKTIFQLLAFAVALLLTACEENSRNTGDDRSIYVSIAPLKAVARSNYGRRFPIVVLVPAGASPESFEPTPKQFIGLNRARLILNVGLLDFEQNLLQKVERQEKIVDLSRGIDIIAGCCSHSHAGHRHAHGVDPHVWTSPRALRIMARNAYEAIHAAFPDSTRYTIRFEQFDERLEALDRSVGERIARSGMRRFLIYHPALTYYARDYGIEQLSIEHEGKEPSARRLAELIETGRREGIRNVFYQSQFPASSVEIIARDLGGETVAIDPLAEDVVRNIESITSQICDRSNE